MTSSKGSMATAKFFVERNKGRTPEQVKMGSCRMHKSKHVFRELAWGMALVGVVVGALFPILVKCFGISNTTAFSTTCVVVALLAGVIVSGVNFSLASRIVLPRLRRLSERMHQTRSAMQEESYRGAWRACNPALCRLNEVDEDEFGDVAQSYNALLHALHNAHMLEDQIRDFTQTLSSKLDLSELGAQALGLLQANARAEGGAIVLERHGEWTVLASRGLTQPEKLVESELFLNAKPVATQMRVSLPPGVAVDAILSHFIPSDVLMTPIENHGYVLGWVILASANPFTEDVPRLMPLLMQGLGLALNNALLHDDLQRLAALDPLTGVYNRRFGYKRLEEELTRAVRDHSSLALLVLDLDHFKRVNDEHGHLSGDKVLIRAASVCQQILRDGDVLLRYGGEEFIVVLPGADIQDAREVAERIRLVISQSKINLGERVLQVTSSIGVAATSGEKAITADELIALADERLYLAKATGRNKVVSES